MTEKLNIVQSTTEPDKRNIWLKDNELKKFGAKGWSTIGGSNTGGGGTSTDKDDLYIYIDFNHFNITFNDKLFTPDINDSTQDTIVINNKELYNTLYNSLFKTNTIVHILSSNEEPHIHIIPTIVCSNTEVQFQMFLEGIMRISIRNK